MRRKKKNNPTVSMCVTSNTLSSPHLYFGSFHYDIVWEHASDQDVFVCLWMNVTLTVYYCNNLNGLHNMLS